MAKSISTKKKETFALAAPEAKSVMVAGDFTGWELSPKNLKRTKNGSWQMQVNLEPGRYEYRFIVDGQWVDDPQCAERAPNPFGGCNCVRVVS